jgi:beta-glucosidase
MNFSNGFMLGAATAAHQVEGNNKNSDFWAQEQLPHTSHTEPSLDAVDHYNRYEEDIRLLADAGLNAYRFSIEWARIQPVKNSWNQNEIEHYRKVLECCRNNGVTPIVTMHHFSSPKWIIGMGGWEEETICDLFAYYCEGVVKNLGSMMEYVCTINEANMGIQLAVLMKDFMAQAGDVQVGVTNVAMERRKVAMMEEAEVFGCKPWHVNTFLSVRTAQGDKLIMRAHEAARDAMKKSCPHLKIGLTLSLHDMQSEAGGEIYAAKEWDDEFLHYLPAIQNDDFLGVQNYTRKCFGPEGAIKIASNAPRTQMGYEDYPSSIGHVVNKVTEQFHGELVITENGIATEDDDRRIEFIREALESVKCVMDTGVKVKGYMYWSLLDNFEWQMGFSKTFGLIAVDRLTQKRMPKKSLGALGSLL